MKYCILLFCFLLFAWTSNAQNGGLDPSFGNNGLVIVPNQSPNFRSDLNGVAIAPDGKILVAGGDLNGGILAMRYNTDGSLDNSFADNGKFIVNGRTDSYRQRAITVNTNGDIYISGKIAFTGGNGDSAFLLRLLPNGYLDSSFGNNGIVTNYWDDSYYTQATVIVLQPDDRIILGGETGAGSYPILSRFLPNGSIDTSLNHTGQMLINTGNNSSLKSLGLLPDGRIVTGGRGTDSFGNLSACSIRLLPDGRMDTTYNHTGIAYATVPVGFTLFVNAAAMQPDGKMLVAGAGADLFALRFDLNGHPDTVFNHTGIFHYPRGMARAIALRQDGKIMLGGNDDALAGGNDVDMTLLRLHPDGRLDSTFGSNGIITTQALPAENKIVALTLQRDQKIVAAGFGAAGSGQGSKGLLARYLPDAPTAISKLPVPDDGVVISPNPAQSVITITNKTGEPLRSVSLVSSEGRVVRSLTSAGNMENIAVAGLPAELYYLFLEFANNKTMTKQVILKQ